MSWIDVNGDEVFDDADLDSVVEGVVDAIWFNQGQVCCAGSRILAQEGIAARLEEKLKARMETLRLGDPLDKAVDIGAIIAPPVPAFYAKPDSLEDMIDHTVERVLDLFDIDVGIVRRWSEDPKLKRRPDSCKDPA